MRFLKVFWPAWVVICIGVGVWAIVAGSALWPLTWFFTIPLGLFMTWFTWSQDA